MQTEDGILIALSVSLCLVLIAMALLFLSTNLTSMNQYEIPSNSSSYDYFSRQYNITNNDNIESKIDVGAFAQQYPKSTVIAYLANGSLTERTNSIFWYDIADLRIPAKSCYNLTVIYCIPHVSNITIVEGQP